MKSGPRLLPLTVIILWTLACLGTQQTLPTHIQNDTNPIVVSPTAAAVTTDVPSPFPGLTIAYLLDGNVWLWDGTSRQLTNDGDAKLVKISDDGKVIVYQRGQSFSTLDAQSLWICNTDDPSSPQVLVPLPIFDPENPSLEKFSITQFKFQPHSHWIHFSTGRPEGTSHDDLYRVNADAPGEPQELLEKDGGLITFSPDGNLLALSSLRNIKVIHPDGSNLITALHYPLISRETGSIPQVVWMENGTGFIPSCQTTRG